METWVKAELPNQRYGLFVDAVSLLDFFSCIGHVDADKTFAAFHNQQKTDFSSMYEARVAASVQNVFPMVLGRSNGGKRTFSLFTGMFKHPLCCLGTISRSKFCLKMRVENGGLLCGSLS